MNRIARTDTFHSCTVFVLFFLSTVCFAAGIAGASGMEQWETETYRYVEQAEDWSLMHTVTIDYGKQVTVTSESSKDRVIKVCTKDGQTVHWSLKENDTAIECRRIGDNLIMKGKKHGEEINERFAIDGHPWYQPGSYCLRRFVTNRENNMFYWIIRRDTLTPVKMKARKEDRCTVTINNSIFSALKVRVRLSGLRSLFWHGDYWFRSSDGLLLRYKGTTGPPGTPEKTVSILAESLGE